MEQWQEVNKGTVQRLFNTDEGERDNRFLVHMTYNSLIIGVSKINKKILIIGILLIIFTSGVGGWKLRDYTLKDHGSFDGVISITDSNLVKELPKGIRDLDLSPQAALEIGNAVMKHMYSAELLKSTDYSVSEFKDRNIYIVIRAPKAPRNQIVLGEETCVAIDKNTGQVLATWFSE